MGSEGHMCSVCRVPPILESFFQLKDKAGSKPVSVKCFLESFDCKSVFAPHNANVLGFPKMQFSLNCSIKYMLFGHKILLSWPLLQGWALWSGLLVMLASVCFLPGTFIFNSLDGDIWHSGRLRLRAVETGGDESWMKAKWLVFFLSPPLFFFCFSLAPPRNWPMVPFMATQLFLTRPDNSKSFFW